MDSTKRFLGIDFGTCNSAMAWFNPKTRQAEVLRNAEGEEKTRSLVYFGNGETLVGTPAEYMLADEALRAFVYPPGAKRHLAKKMVLLLGDRKVTPLDVAVEVLRKLKRDAEELHFHAEVSRVALTVPAIFDQLERDTVAEAGRRAGFQEIELLDEPVAAALAYAHDGLEVGKRVLVYDLGAGTLDLALLVRADEREPLSLALPACGLRKGGDDFDRLLYHYVEQQAQEEKRSLSQHGKMNLEFLRHCRERKENLSLRSEVQFSSLLPDGRPFRHQVERKKLESLIEPIVAETVAQAVKMRQDAQNLGWEIDTVVLIGGSSRVPLVATMLQEKLPINPQKWQNQDFAVALGAAYHAEALWGSTRPKKLLPFHFRSGGTAFDLEALISLCGEYPEDAEWHLANGHFAAWLHDTGHGELAKHARMLGEYGQCSRECLGLFLRECGPAGAQWATRLEGAAREAAAKKEQLQRCERYRQEIQSRFGRRKPDQTNTLPKRVLTDDNEKGDLAQREIAYLREQQTKLGLSQAQAEAIERQELGGATIDQIANAQQVDTPSNAKGLGVGLGAILGVAIGGVFGAIGGGWGGGIGGLILGGFFGQFSGGFLGAVVGRWLGSLIRQLNPK